MIRSFFSFFSIYLFLTTTAYLFSQSPYEEIKDKAQLPILTPSYAERHVLKLKLANGLEAYLISDPEATKSAAALAVKTGSWEDPVEHPGVAHFLEHMLFLGTEKYPVEADYDRFIKAHDGNSNAYTAGDHTLYMFSIHNSAFEEALDRFSFFFKQPLFNPSGVSRELQAIDQEFAKNFNSDDFRQHFVQKELANPNHPFHQFSIGNLDTLSKVSQGVLKQWYKEHYSANLMRLVVYSPLPLAELKTLVINDFGGIPTNNHPSFKIDAPILSDKEKGNFIYVEPLKDVQTLELTWELPPSFAEMRDTKPEALVCYLLGHEGEHTLFDKLRSEGLAEALECAGSQLGPSNFLFSIQIDLTLEGLKQVDTIIQYCFEAINFVKAEGIPPYIFDELKKMSTIRYQYQSRDEPMETVMKLAAWLTQENLETFPEQTQIIQRFDPQSVHKLLEELTPQNLMVTLMAKSERLDMTFNQKETWMHVPYRVRKFSEEELHLWSNPKNQLDLRLPAANPFIPTALDLPKQTKTAYHDRMIPRPKLLVDSEEGKLYFTEDTIYGALETTWFFEVKTPSIKVGNASQVVLTDLYIKCLKESLNPFSYDAQLADLNYDITRGNNGINITIQGYSQNAERLFEEIIKRLTNCVPNEQKFNAFKYSLLSQYQNAAKESSLKQGFDLFRSVIYKNFTTSSQAAEALSPLSYQNYKDHVTHLFDKAYIGALFYGNIKEDSVWSAWNKIKKQLNAKPYPPADQLKMDIIVLPDQGPYYLSLKVQSQGNAAILGVEEAGFSFKARAAQQILSQAMNNPFYSTLRTLQQTGYIVANAAEEIEKHLFNIFAVQSNTHDARDLLSRFELFIEGFLQEMSQTYLNKENFETIKDSLLSTLEQPPQNLFEMGVLLRNLAFKYEGDFDWIAKRIKGFEDLNYEDFLEMAAQSLGKVNKKRLAVLVEGNWPENKTFLYRNIQESDIRATSQYTPSDQKE